jgi:hypothetical protein
MMKLMMFTFISKQFKIFNSIIISNLIKMMNSFTRLKRSFKMFLHYETMLKNVATTIARWMSWQVDKNISLRNFSSISTIVKALRRTILFSSSFKLKRVSPKSFLANRTSDSRVNVDTFSPLNSFVPSWLSSRIDSFWHRSLLFAYFNKIQ